MDDDATHATADSFSDYGGKVAPKGGGAAIVAPYATVSTKPKKRGFLILLAVLCAVVLLGVVVGVVVGTKDKSSRSTSTGALVDGAVGAQEEDDGDSLTDDGDDEEPLASDEDVLEPPTTVEWVVTDTEDILDAASADRPLFSVGNFTGLGSVVATSMADSPPRIFFGDPDTGCVSALVQTSGWELDRMWSWQNNGEEPPELTWEQMGEPVCPEDVGAGFGTQVGVPSDPARVSDDWNGVEIEDTVTFIASNPTDGTLTIYSFDVAADSWEIKQTIDPPADSTLESFHSEDGYITANYLPSSSASVAVARSVPLRSSTDATIQIYRYDYQTSMYERVAEGTTFVGVDVDTGSKHHRALRKRGHHGGGGGGHHGGGGRRRHDKGVVATLGEDRSIRVYGKECDDSSEEEGEDAAENTYSQIGPAFKPAFVLDTAETDEEDLTIALKSHRRSKKIMTAAIVDAGDGSTTLGIGNYEYTESTNTWDPSFHGAVELDLATPSSAVNFNPKGTSAMVATESGFMVIDTKFSWYSGSASMEVVEYDIGLDDTADSHEIVDLAAWGVVTVNVQSGDDSEIRMFMTAGC